MAWEKFRKINGKQYRFASKHFKRATAKKSAEKITFYSGKKTIVFRKEKESYKYAVYVKTELPTIKV